MVFKTGQLKPAGQASNHNQRPCLEHMRQLSIWADQPLGHVLSMVSGLWPPILNETKLRENATNNPGQRCICSKHGLSLAGMSAPGDLGQQILKTMLRRYEALGGLWRYRFQRGPQVC